MNNRHVPFVKDVLTLLAGIGLFSLGVGCILDSSITETLNGKIASYITLILGVVLLGYSLTFPNTKESKQQMVKSVE